MAENSKIEWTQSTWNPVVGCTRVSSGCDHCYAFTMTKRLEAMGQENYRGLAGNGHFNGVVRALTEALGVPMRRKKPTTYFVNSMSDLFHKGVLDDFIDQVFAVMASCPQHTFQILTKRADRMAEYMCDPSRLDNIYDQWYGVNDQPACAEAWPLPNVWLGVSVESQAAADERIPGLLHVPAAVRFLSCEPLLGPVDLTLVADVEGFEVVTDTLRGNMSIDGQINAPVGGINWVIVGGESGAHARPMHPDWVRSLRDQCQDVGVPFFFKQWGAWIPQSQMTDEQYGLVAELDPDSAGGVGRFKRDNRLSGGELFWHVGKKAAGRMLDGQQWDMFPVAP